jgi:hypothetical protein
LISLIGPLAFSILGTTSHPEMLLVFLDVLRVPTSAGIYPEWQLMLSLSLSLSLSLPLTLPPYGQSAL